MGPTELLDTMIAPVRAVGNAISGRAVRPLDILRTRPGLAAEVGDTDAEDRLVLADLLARAAEEGPDFLLDPAALTGAVRIALCPNPSALFTGNTSPTEALPATDRDASDPVWRMPLLEGYASWLDSSSADSNILAAARWSGR